MSNNSSQSPRSEASSASSSTPSTPTTSQGNGSSPNYEFLRRGSRKRGVVHGGIVESWEAKLAEYYCPICFQTLTEASITTCGHTFCKDCIFMALQTGRKLCPVCASAIFVDGIFPNHALDVLVTRLSSKTMKTDLTEASKSNSQEEPSEPSSISKILSVGNYNKLSVNEIDTLMTLLKRKREVLTVEAHEHQRTLLLEFLKRLLSIRKTEKEQLDREIDLIETDIDHVQGSSGPDRLEVPDASSNGNTTELNACSTSSETTPGFNTQILGGIALEQNNMVARKRRLYSHFDELSKIYKEIRTLENHNLRIDGTDTDALDDFGHTLSRITRYDGLKPLATLSYSADLLSNSNIVSSIEFDKDNEFFAIAGVTRKIKVFEYANVIGSAVDIHCPQTELQCTAKISCVAWSSYYKHHLASSDYEGCVSLWDVSVGKSLRVLNEHEKRVWSVDWSNGDPRLLASGSDDSKVKLWSTNADRAVATLEGKANVCCVKFCPKNSFVIAFGCADHCVHYYDFRQTRDPLGILKGHKKAVSYVKFASTDELVSASTDSQLKLWNLETMDCLRSFNGHVNEKNFVGLATDGNYIACGSENNSLYVYYKYLSKPLFSFKFDNHRNMLDRPRADESVEFVSAVAWKKGSPVVVAANSQGAIKVLELM